MSSPPNGHDEEGGLIRFNQMVKAVKDTQVQMGPIETTENDTFNPDLR